MEVYKDMPEKRKDFFSYFRLRVTQPIALNDPYECLPAISPPDYDLLFEQAINRMNEVERSIVLSDLENAKKNLIDQYERTGELERKLTEILRTGLSSRIGILSLSKRNDSALMWSHYTDSHKGFVVGFDSNHNFFKKQQDDNAEIGELSEVHYSINRPAISILGNNLTTKHFLCKNIEWEYEEELRLIRNLNNASNVINDQEPKIFLFDIPKNCISSVIFGMQCAQELQQEIQNLIRNDAELNSVKLLKAYMDRKSCKIQTYELT